MPDLYENRKAAGKRDLNAEQENIRHANHRGVAYTVLTEYQVRLTHASGWYVDVYPTKQRLYRPEGHKPRAPFLPLPSPWKIRDVIDAIADYKGGSHA